MVQCLESVTMVPDFEYYLMKTASNVMETGVLPRFLMSMIYKIVINSRHRPERKSGLQWTSQGTFQGCPAGIWIVKKSYMLRYNRIPHELVHICMFMNQSTSFHR